MLLYYKLITKNKNNNLKGAKMRTINLKDVTQKVRDLFIDACENIPENVLNALKNAVKEEESPLGKQVLQEIIDNDLLAREKHLPICQDTGVAVVYITMTMDRCGTRNAVQRFDPPRL